MNEVVYFFDSWSTVVRVAVVGALMYLAVVALLRLTGSRTLASLNVFDFIVTVAIGSAFGRALTAKSVGLVEAVVAFAVLVALQYLFSALLASGKAFFAAESAVS